MDLSRSVLVPVTSGKAGSRCSTSLGIRLCLCSSVLSYCVSWIRIQVFPLRSPVGHRKLQAYTHSALTSLRKGFPFSNTSRKNPRPASHGHRMDLMYHPDRVSMAVHSWAHLCRGYVSSTLIIWLNERAVEEKGNNTSQETTWKTCIHFNKCRSRLNHINSFGQNGASKGFQMAHSPGFIALR